jgi:hypothetical protein
MLTPAFTGIDWPAFEAGRLDAEMLIGGELVVRDSTGPARGVAAARQRSGVPATPVREV